MCLVTHTGQRHEKPKAKQLSPVDSVQTRHSHRHKRSIMHIKIAMQWNAIGTRYGLKTNINVSSPFVVVVVVVIWLNCTEMGKHSPGRATHSHIIFIAISCGQLLHFSHTHTHLTQTRTDNRHTPRRIDGIFHVFFLSFVFFIYPGSSCSVDCYRDGAAKSTTTGRHRRRCSKSRLTLLLTVFLFLFCFNTGPDTRCAAAHWRILYFIRIFFFIIIIFLSFGVCNKMQMIIIETHCDAIMRRHAHTQSQAVHIKDREYWNWGCGTLTWKLRTKKKKIVNVYV